MDFNLFKQKSVEIVQKAAPLFRFIPEGPRKKIADRIYSSFTLKYRLPKPYVKDKFPYGINLFGYFKSENGLAQGAKLYARALEESDIPHTLLALNTNDQNDQTYNSKLADEPKYAVNLIHSNANFWQKTCAEFPHVFFDRHYNIGVWMWELEKAPEEWSAVIDGVDEIWVPSEFAARPWRQMTDKPVTVIPYGIEVPYDKSLKRADFGLSEDKFLVLIMFDSLSFSSRKNPIAAIKAFLKAFNANDKKPHLVIKISNPSEKDLEMINGILNDKDRFTLITERMDKVRLNALIRLCDVLISLHRSEGFGLVMAEAMALGKPVVATNWSANVEFMSKETACMVDYTLIPVKNFHHDNMDAVYWADADVDQAAYYLKRLFEDKEFYQSLSVKGSHHIKTHLVPEIAAAKMKARVNQIIYAKQE